MAPYIPVKAIIFDLGDVLFQWSRETTTSIPPKTMGKIVSSPSWYEYERGALSRELCYEQVAQLFQVEASQVAEAFAQARSSLQADPAMMEFIKQTRSKYPLKIYAMSNVSKEDFTALEERMDSTLFDGVFASGAHGVRKPELDFYRQVLKEIEMVPEEVVFVDDKLVNVEAAISLGIRGLVFDDGMVQKIQDILSGPIAKGYDYLSQNAKQFDSETDSGVPVGDNFAKLLIAEVTEDPNLINVDLNTKGTWNFFSGKATLIPGGLFPNDLDTTSLALVALPSKNAQAVTEILDQMAKLVTPEGLFLTYFDRNRPRTDIVVSANILACFYRFGRGHQFPQVLQRVRDVILNRGYLKGSRYYPSPDCCLAFFTRLEGFVRNYGHVRSALGWLLRSRLQERVGEKGNAFDLAMRIIACDSLGIECSVDRQTLLSLQCQDGSWETGWLYSYGSTGVRIGNRGVTTAMALKALRASPWVFTAAIRKDKQAPALKRTDSVYRM